MTIWISIKDGFIAADVIRWNEKVYRSRPSRRRRAACDASWPWRLCCFALVASVALSKVFSPQYLVWAVPLALCVVAPSSNPRIPAWAYGLGLLVTTLTAWIFPYHYFSNIRGVEDPWGLVPGLSPVASAVLVARNICYVGLAALAGAALVRSAVGNAPEREAAGG